MRRGSMNWQVVVFVVMVALVLALLIIIKKNGEKVFGLLGTIREALS